MAVRKLVGEGVLVYHPRIRVGEVVLGHALGFEVSFVALGGVALRCWVIACPAPAGCLLLCFEGLGRRADRLLAQVRTGLHVAILGGHGYGALSEELASRGLERLGTVASSQLRHAVHVQVSLHGHRGPT